MKLLIIFVLILAGCVTHGNDARQLQFDQFADQINAQRDAKQINYTDGQKNKRDFQKGLWPDDPYSTEYFTCTIMLAEKVDKGEMAESEYMYLNAKKAGEMRERPNADGSRRIRDAAAITSPTQTQCHSDGFGNTNCTTY